MALRPEDRYASPRALADDVEHWLADEPVSAYREPLAARLARWARRHRTAVAGAAALLVDGVGRPGDRHRADRPRVGTPRGAAAAGRAQLRAWPATPSTGCSRGSARSSWPTSPRWSRSAASSWPRPCSSTREFRSGGATTRSLRLELGRALIRLARVQELLGDSARGRARPIAGRSRLSGTWPPRRPRPGPTWPAPGTAWGCS